MYQIMNQETGLVRFPVRFTSKGSGGRQFKRTHFQVLQEIHFCHIEHFVHGFLGRPVQEQLIQFFTRLHPCSFRHLVFSDKARFYLSYPLAISLNINAGLSRLMQTDSHISLRMGNGYMILLSETAFRKVHVQSALLSPTSFSAAHGLPGIPISGKELSDVQIPAAPRRPTDRHKVPPAFPSPARFPICHSPPSKSSAAAYLLLLRLVFFLSHRQDGHFHLLDTTRSHLQNFKTVILVIDNLMQCGELSLQFQQKAGQ